MYITRYSPCAAVIGCEQGLVNELGGGRYLYRSLLSYPNTELLQWLDEPTYSDTDIQNFLSEIGERTVHQAYRMDIPWEYDIPLDIVVGYLKAHTTTSKMFGPPCGTTQ
jgi:hypothetical protein